MLPPDSTYNLTALADRLISEGRMPSLAGKIHRARELHSLGADLAIAIESLNALDALLKEPIPEQDVEKLATASALLNNAIVLYARATKTTSAERRGYDLRSKFTDEQKAVHAELCDLRDNAVSHFGSGEIYSGEWKAELTILQYVGEDGKVGVSTRRLSVDKNLAKRARVQIEVAHDQLRNLALDMIEQVRVGLSEAASADPEFYKELQKHPLNFPVFMTSQNAADLAVAAFNAGYAKGGVHHGEG